MNDPVPTNPADALLTASQREATRKWLELRDELGPDDAELASVHLYAPSLLPLAERLRADSDGAIGIDVAGPQPDSTDYDPEEEPYFFVTADVHRAHHRPDRVQPATQPQPRRTRCVLPPTTQEDQRLCIPCPDAIQRRNTS
jgi:hypothetical protein